VKRKKCPGCGRDMPEFRHGCRFTPMEALVFDIVSSCPDGIESTDLLDRVRAVSNTLTKKTLTVYVHYINSNLEDTGYRIKRYSLPGNQSCGCGRKKGSSCCYYLAKPEKHGSTRALQLESS
jgi:hypothetical protein